MADKDTTVLTIDKAIHIKKSKSLESIPPMYLPDVFSSEYFFISYSHLDYVDVYLELLRLQDAGLQFWYDRGMPAGSDWEVVARRNITPFACKGIIFFISENALKSKAVLGELKYAKQFNKPVILIMMPFSNDNYVDEKGKKIKGKTYDIATALYLLRINNVDINDEEGNKEEELKELFPSNTIYLPYDMDSAIKVEKIKNKIEEVPVLDTTLTVDPNDSYQMMNIFKCNDTSVTKLDIGQAMFTKPIDKVDGIVIKDSAFANCEFLREINFDGDYANEPDILVDSYAFLNCVNLTHINTAKSFYDVVSLHNGAFKHCHELVCFKLGTEEEYTYNLCSLHGDYIFAHCYELQEVNLTSTRRIGNSVFLLCEKLSRITGTSKIYYVGDRAFFRCESLKEIELPNVREIGDKAFYGCTELKEFYLPSSIEYVGKDAFTGTGIKCTSKNGIIYLGNDYRPYLVAFGVEDDTLTHYELDKTCRAIAGGAFESALALETIKLPPDLISIGTDAFRNCSSLKKIRLPRSLKKIGPSAFRGCISLEKISFFDEIVEIGEYAFYDCEFKKFRLYGDLAQLEKINIGVGNDPLYTNNSTREFVMSVSWTTNVFMAISFVFLVIGIYVLITSVFFPGFVEKEVEWALGLPGRFAPDEMVKTTFNSWGLWFTFWFLMFAPCIAVKIFNPKK